MSIPFIFPHPLRSSKATLHSKLFLKNGWNGVTTPEFRLDWAFADTHSAIPRHSWTLNFAIHMPPSSKATDTRLTNPTSLNNPDISESNRSVAEYELKQRPIFSSFYVYWHKNFHVQLRERAVLDASNRIERPAFVRNRRYHFVARLPTS